ncbi:MAG: NUDIX domain-containing protein [Alphaproteobacteria bacterium]|nr:NUDIX domain-containing protein [Alphaproteobacteria bacterium]
MSADRDGGQVPPPSFGADDVEMLRHETLYSGYSRLHRYTFRHRLHDGRWTRPFTREVYDRGAAAAVLLYDPFADAVVFVEQFRPGAHAAGRAPWQLEPVGGMIEPGEDPTEVVRREAIEEAGCEILDLLHLFDYLPSVASYQSPIHLYAGRVDAARAAGVHGRSDEDEETRVVVLRSDAAFAAMVERPIISAGALLSLQWLRLNRAELRRRWGVGVQAGE